MGKINKNSIAVKLSIVMIVIIVAQALLLATSFWLSGIVSELEENAYTTSSQSVKNRKNYLEDEMNMYYSNFDPNEIVNIYEKNILLKGGSTEENINQFLKESSIELVPMLRSTLTTGAYIILDNEGQSDSYHTIYLKDDDPLFNHPSGEDIFMLKGPIEVSRQLQIPLHSEWNYGITLNADHINLLKKPIMAFEVDKNIERLGYWMVSPDLGTNEKNMITYTQPLIDSAGNAFGVIGVEISQDYFYKMLPKDEIDKNSSLGYIIGMRDSITEEITPVLLDSLEQKELFAIGEPIELKLRNKSTQVYEIVNDKSKEVVLGYVENFMIYDKNSPYIAEEWVLIGLVEEDHLLEFSNDFIRKAFLAFVFLIVSSTVVAAIVGVKFAKPIVLLSKKVNKNDLRTVVDLGRTGYTEIDELSVAIEGFNRNILDVAMKTDKIIQMVNLPLATFEYDTNTNIVKGSQKLLELLDLDYKSNDKNFIDSTIFFHKIEEIKQRVEDQDKKFYLLKDNPAKWVKIVTVEQECMILGAVMDVTSEILDKYAIKFERDYDSLTNLLNRFAFTRKIEMLFQKGIQDFSAFVVFDLDNLKFINDTYGHDMGDKYIQEAAKNITSILQNQCVVGRMSGDEFYAFLYGFESKEKIRNQLQKMYQSLEVNQIILPNGNHFKIRMSGGIAWYGEDSKNINELIRFADFAMYQGKHTVKGEIREFQKEAYIKESFMLSGREELNKILDNQLIEYVFQPIVSCKTGKVYGYEALMRPHSEILNTPIKLLQIATAQSQLWKIEKITFFKAISSYQKFSDKAGNAKLFINSIPNEMLKDNEYLELEQLYPEILDKIVIEITENEKLDTSILAEKRKLIERWGGNLALDDYGSGYNGDISLITLLPQIVKIDRNMIEGIETDRNRQSIVQKLLVYAKEQDVIVLAEGVETFPQMKYLINMGVELLQGYYIGKPKTSPEYDTTNLEKEILEIHKERLEQ